MFQIRRCWHSINTIYFIASYSPFFFSPAARFIYFWHLIASMSFVQMRRGSSVVGHFRRSLLACTSVVGHFWWGPYVSLNQTFSIHTKHCRDTASQSAPWPRCQSRIVIGSWLDLTLTRKSWLDYETQGRWQDARRVGPLIETSKGAPLNNLFSGCLVVPFIIICLVVSSISEHFGKICAEKRSPPIARPPLWP